MPRIHCDLPLATGSVIDLPAGAARHVQVLRLQPGDGITLFHGAPTRPTACGSLPPEGAHLTAARLGGEYEATITQMGRSNVQVRVGAHHATEREAPRTVHLALGMPANDRMDWLVEKATELGVASIQPLVTERSVLRLSGERAQKKRDHWQAVAIAACEQCGRNRVPPVFAVKSLSEWLVSQAPSGADMPRLLLSLRAETQPVLAAAGSSVPVQFLSGPEGGLSAAEEAAALAVGFQPVTLGPRVLRAETAPLAALVALTLADSQVSECHKC